MPQVTKMPERCFKVPFLQNTKFVGRHTQLDRLQSTLFAEGYPLKTAITGLGGMGKTQLALELAYRTRDKYLDCSIFWVPATNAEGLQQAFTEIGQELGLPGIMENPADAKQLVQRHLSEQSTGKWFLIIDNIDDMELWKNELRDYLPRSQEGHVVCTTRNRKFAVDTAMWNVVDVPAMEDKSAMELLGKLLPNHNQKLSEWHLDARNLLEELAFIPLAIRQAAAFIHGNGSTLSKYLSLLNDQEQEVIELLSTHFEDEGRYTNDKNITNPVATTWLISFEQISRLDPLAADYLSFISCVASKNIPESLLPPGSSKLKQENAIGTLDAYSFVTRQATDAALDVDRHLDVHRLVQLATRNWLRLKHQWRACADKALARLVEVVPLGGHKNMEIWTAYLPHAVHVVGLVEIGDTKGMMSLLDRIGRCQQALGLYEAAVSAHRQLLTRRVEAAGKEHPDTLLSMNEVGLALSYQGKHAEAEQMHQETLVVRKKVLGDEHPGTLASMNNLAEVLRHQGKHAEAEQLHQEALVVKKKVLGEEHPSTLASMNNLAEVLRQQGKHAEAEQMHQETLVVRKKVLGDEHPDTLTSMNNLAEVLSQQGKHAEAEQMHQETLVVRKKVLGDKHPDTLISMNNVAWALSRQGKKADALLLMRDCAQLRQKILGPQHPHAQKSLKTLSKWEKDVGD